MKEFQKLKEEQFSCLEDVRKFEALVGLMNRSGIDLLEKSLATSSYLVEADGLAKQLQNPNISLSVVAEVSNGKSTFLNALIFKDQVLHSGLGAVTARLFKVDYGSKYTLTTENTISEYRSIDSLKESIKQLNIETRKKMDKQKEVSEKDIKEICITLPHQSLKDGITLYDTPGFGALDETLVYPIIREAVAKSDAVIMLFDISQGIKKGEDKFVRDVLKSIPPDKRFVVFNKIDAVINEDQKMLMGEDELNEQLQKVKNDTLNQLSTITNIPKEEIANYALSSSQALVGFKLNNQEKIDNSYFEAFEKELWHKVVSSKKEIFENRIRTYENLISSCTNNTKKVKKRLKENYEELANLKSALINRKAEFSSFSKQSISSLDENIKNFNSNTSISFNINLLLDKIEKILNDDIYDATNEINWIDKVQVWKIRDKYISKIEDALKESEYDIGQSISNYTEDLAKELNLAQEEINNTIGNINKNINNFSDLGISNLAKIEILVEKSSELYNFNGKDIKEAITNNLSEIILEFTFGIYAIYSYLYSKFYSDSKKFYGDVASRVASDLKNVLKERLSTEFEIYTSKTNEIKQAMSLALLGAKANLQMIENSFENPEDREKDLALLKKDIATLGTYENSLNTLQRKK